MRHSYPLHLHISTLFLGLILVICGVLTAIAYKLSSELLAERLSASEAQAGILYLAD